MDEKIEAGQEGVVLFFHRIEQCDCALDITPTVFQLLYGHLAARLMFHLAFKAE